LGEAQTFGKTQREKFEFLLMRRVGDLRESKRKACVLKNVVFSLASFPEKKPANLNKFRFSMQAWLNDVNTAKNDFP
jgi:hypothetical protein